jgi:hypothetical protein
VSVICMGTEGGGKVGAKSLQHQVNQLFERKKKRIIMVPQET